jgi:hypothetical protein
MNLTPYHLTRVRIELDDFWKNEASSESQAYESGNIGSIASMQTATFDFLDTNIKKEVRAEIRYLIPAAITETVVSENQSDSSDFGAGGGMPTAASYDVNITEANRANVAKIPVSEIEYRTELSAGKLLGIQVNAAIKAADAKKAKLFYTKIKAAATPLMKLKTGITVSGNSHIISQALWANRAELMTVIKSLIRRNRIHKPIIISGEELISIMDLANFNKGNADGSGENASLKAFSIYAGGLPMELVEERDDVFYLIDANCFVFLNRNKYKEPTPIVHEGVNRLAVRVPSKSFKGSYYDLITAIKTENGTDYVFAMLKSYYDVFLRPADVNGGFSGVYRFEKAS